MFVRIKKSGKYKYLQIVKNIRIWGEVKQEVVASLGRLDKYMEDGNLNRLGHNFIGLYAKLTRKPDTKRKKKKAA